MENNVDGKTKLKEEIKQFIDQSRSDTRVIQLSEIELSKYFHIRTKSFHHAIRDLIKEDFLVENEGKGIFIPSRNKIREIHIYNSPDCNNNDHYYTSLLHELSLLAVRYAINLVYISGRSQLTPVSDQTPLILLGTIDDRSLIDQISHCYKRVVAAQNYSSYDTLISQLFYNGYKTGWKAAELITDYNHRKIMILSGPEDNPFSLYLKNGFLDALSGRNLQLEVYTNAMTAAGGCLAALHILQEMSPEERPTAVFAVNDQMAIGLMNKLQENGISIPGDISVVGCDNLNEASSSKPALTTFNQDIKYLSAELLTLLNRLTITDEEVTHKILLPAPLILRESLINYAE